eukprot:Amastigsp_a340072_106.p5 type:complete len:120 gc:universal Amastigsp_a340072_106:2040-1681(-)
MPLRWLTCEMTAPWYSMGASISTFITGSRMIGAASRNAAWSALRAAVRNACSFESTECESPSVSTNRMPVMGCPVNGPFSMASRTPFSIAGLNCGGMLLPTVASSNTNVSSEPSSSGSM